MDLPTISVVTPSFNQAQFLERTIRSVLDQDYPRLEYLVLDGGSSDQSPAVIERYAERLAYWRSAPDNGQSAAVNEGWRRSTGEILGWINSDDFYEPGALRFVGEYFSQRPEVSFLYGTAAVVDARERQLGIFGEPFDRRRYVRGQMTIPQPSTFLRRSLVIELGPLDESLHYAMDLDLFLRASLRTVPTFVANRLAAYTVHPTAKTIGARSATRREAYRVCLRHAKGLDRLVVLARLRLSTVFQWLPPRLRRAIDGLRPSPYGAKGGG